MSARYVDIANLRGPQGDVTPAAQEALAQARAARDTAKTHETNARSARAGAEAARDLAEAFAQDAGGQSDEALAGLIGDASTASHSATSEIAHDTAAAAFLSSVPVAPPLDALRAAVSGGSVRVVGLGSSTMAGSGATAGCGFFDRLAARVGQTAVTTLEPAPDLTGRMFVNGAISGATAANFLTPGALSAVTRIDPTFILVMVGSNDAATGVSTSTYRTRMLSACEQLRNAAPRATLVLIHQQGRNSVSVVDWRAYGRVLAEVAAAHERHLFVDVAALAEPVGMFSWNTFGLIGSDNIHLTDAGHRWLADVLAARLGLPQVPRILERRSVVATESNWTQDRVAAEITLPAVGYPRLVHVGGSLFLERVAGTGPSDLRIEHSGTYQSYRIPTQEGGGSIPLSTSFVAPPNAPVTVRARVITNGRQIRVSDLSTWSRMSVTAEPY